jgi:hypothetical protein
MRSRLAEELKEETRAAARALDVEARLAAMLEAGEKQLQTYMAANAMSRDDAIRELEHRRQAGRRPSRCMEQIIDESRPPRPRDP